MLDQAGRRRQVLLAWAFVLRQRGEVVPTNEDLIQIALANSIPPGLRTPLTNRWAHVLHHLMYLSNQGHPDPVKDALGMAPSGPSGQWAGADSRLSSPVPPPSAGSQMSSAPRRERDWAALDRSSNWRSQGPFDRSELKDFVADSRTFDFGSITLRQLPPEASIRLQIIEGTETITAITIDIDQSILELSAWAGPEGPGFWTEIRSDLIRNVRAQGGSAECAPGPFGTEVISNIPQRSPSGELEIVVTRTWVVEGPGWILRGVIGGAAARASQQPVDSTLLTILRNVVVSRGDAARTKGELLPLHAVVASSVAESDVGETATVPSPPDPDGTLPQSDAQTGPAAVADDPLHQLMMWRNREGLDELKDRHLRQIVNSDVRSVEEVAALLPASLKPLAGPVAGVLGVPDTDEVVPARIGSPEPQGDPDHAAVPAEPQPHPAANPEALTWEQPEELREELNQFTEMDFSQPIGEPAALKVSSRADGSLTLRWPEPPDPARVTIFRVVSDDGYAPLSPDMSEVIAITVQRSLVDPRPFTSGVRHYQVWANQGESTQQALLEQPTLVAQLPVVERPSHVDIREDEGRVIGQWRLIGNARRVQIFRVPAERAGRGTGDPAYRICADSANLAGFVDDGAEPGRRYLYQLLVEAEVNGTPQLSLATTVQVTTSAVLHPVEDLTCTLGDEEQPRFDLVWTAPQAGRVVVYRTATGPRAGADAETVAESALLQMGLKPEDRLAHPIEREGDRGTMRSVPWPRGWSRTYFTPVTMIDGQARVGRTIAQVRTSSVTDARIVERVSQQVLTMAWPDGAAAIKVYASYFGQPAHEAIEGAEPIAEISADTYVRLGGLQFPRPLDAGGCDLHLLPISFAGGHAVEGRPTTVRYRGLLRLWYDVEVRRPRLGRGPVLLFTRIRADRPNPTAPAFALIHNPDRLPLDINDGEPILMHHAVEHPQQPSPRFWPASLTTTPSEPGWVGDITNRVGFVRVFVDMPRNPEMGTVALIDPPLAHLYLGGR